MKQKQNTIEERRLKAIHLFHASAIFEFEYYIYNIWFPTYFQPANYIIYLNHFKFKTIKVIAVNAFEQYLEFFWCDDKKTYRLYIEAKSGVRYCALCYNANVEWGGGSNQI